MGGRRLEMLCGLPPPENEDADAGVVVVDMLGDEYRT